MKQADMSNAIPEEVTDWPDWVGPAINEKLAERGVSRADHEVRLYRQSGALVATASPRAASWSGRGSPPGHFIYELELSEAERKVVRFSVAR